MRELIFDVETTGTDPVKNDIIELGGIIKVNGKKVDEFNYLCQPYSYDNISVEALKVNNININDLRFAPTGHKVGKFISEKLRKHYNGSHDRFIIVAHNAEFDIKFLSNFMYKHEVYMNLASLFYEDVFICTLTFARYLKYLGLIKREYLGLKHLAKEFGIEYNKEEAHRALYDCKVLDGVWSHIQRLLKGTPSKESVDQLSLF